MNDSNHILFRLTDVQPRNAFQFLHPLTLEMARGENWLVYGPNGAGKTYLIKTIMQAFPYSQGTIAYDFSPSSSKKVSENILYVTFHDQYGETGSTFYQLRWNQGLLGTERLPRVKDTFDKASVKNTQLLHILETKLHIDDLMDRYIISLSSGEFRRFQIAKIILQNPRLLIIENPYIGLDEQNREQVAYFLREVIRQLPIQVILVLSRIPKDLSAFTHIVTVKDREVVKRPISAIQDLSGLEPQSLPDGVRACIDDCFSQLPPGLSYRADSDEILCLRDVSIKYGDRTILKNLNWLVRRGEHWALQGENGAGKSTLLSIVCADNPQSYASDVTLFGSRRGSGESIWDIKKHIGYVSPEIFKSYRKPLPVENIIASGLYDSIGLYKKIKDEDFERINLWLRLFGVEDLRKRNYLELSSGEQRLILLVRAFVKNPDLLILDEPFHGMDAYNRLLAKYIIERYCQIPHKTLIMVSHYQEDFPTTITHHLLLKKNK